jgi:hypothetical protein
MRYYFYRNTNLRADLLVVEDGVRSGARFALGGPHLFKVGKIDAAGALAAFGARLGSPQAIVGEAV